MPHDEAVLLDMLFASQRAVDAIAGAAFDVFENDWKLQSIVIHQLVALGEA